MQQHTELEYGRCSFALLIGNPDVGRPARGALVEAGGPPIGAEWADRDHVWADIAPKLYAAAAAAQWDPATAATGRPR